MCPPHADRLKHSELHCLQCDYRQPYVRGTGDPLKTALEGTIFNNRKTSGVFNSGRCQHSAAYLLMAHMPSSTEHCWFYTSWLMTQPSAAALHAFIYQRRPFEPVCKLLFGPVGSFVQLVLQSDQAPSFHPKLEQRVCMQSVQRVLSGGLHSD